MVSSVDQWLIDYLFTPIIPLSGVSSLQPRRRCGWLRRKWHFNGENFLSTRQALHHVLPPTLHFARHCTTCHPGHGVKVNSLYASRLGKYNVSPKSFQLSKFGLWILYNHCYTIVIASPMKRDCKLSRNALNLLKSTCNRWDEWNWKGLCCSFASGSSVVVNT